MIERETRGSVVVLTMKHGKVNVLDLELCDALARAFQEVRVGDAEGVVVTGSGDAFSAGIDLRRLLAGGAAYVERFVPAISSLLERVLFFPRPVVAAINGHAIAGGCLLAACCDRRILARGAWKVGTPELRVGVPFPPHGLEALRSMLPPHVFHDVAYTGRTWSGDDALAHGLADELSEPAELLDRAVAEAARLGACADVFRTTKEQIRLPIRHFLNGQGARLEQHAMDVWRKPATMEAVRRYVKATLER